MATSSLRTWEGKVRDKVQQVSTVTISSNTDGHTFTISLRHPSGSAANDVVIATDTASSDTVTSIAAELVTQFNASLSQFAQVITAEANAGVITLTADYAGIPFVVSVSGTGTITTATTTKAVGPNIYDYAGNWLEGAVPIADDEVVITGSSDILYGLAQSNIELDAFTIHNFTGSIGWPNAPLQIDTADAATWVVDANAAGVMYLDAGSAAVSPSIIATGQSWPYGLYLKGTALATLRLFPGTSIALALNKSETATVTTVENRGGYFCAGPSTTITNYKQVGGHGTLYCENNFTLIEIEAGEFFEYTTGTQAMIRLFGGRSQLAGSGQVTAMHVHDGLADLAVARVTRTYDAIHEYRPGGVNLPSNVSGVSVLTITAHTRYYSVKAGAQGKYGKGGGDGGFGYGGGGGR